MSGAMQDRIAVVTGASRGIGRVIARGLAEAGAQVVAVARSIDDLATLERQIKDIGGKVLTMPLDLRDASRIWQFADSVGTRFGRVDALVGNAGLLGDITPLRSLDANVWTDVMAVNVTANWHLIRTCDALLRRSDAGRALFITAGSPRRIAPNWGIYTITKTALEALVRTYATELRDTPARANLFNPGPVSVGMRRRVAPDEDPSLLDAPEALLPQMIRMLSPDFGEQCVLYDFPTKSLLRFADDAVSG